MKDIVVKAIIRKEFNESPSPVLIGMIFDDLLTLLKFIHRSQREGLLKEPFLFTSQIDYLDRCWHQFILHTNYYYDFCFEEFGEYLHHIPENAVARDLNGSQDSLERVLELQIKAVEKNLGAEYSNRIFFLYPEILQGAT